MCVSRWETLIIKFYQWGHTLLPLVLFQLKQKTSGTHFFSRSFSVLFLQNISNPTINFFTIKITFGYQIVYVLFPDVILVKKSYHNYSLCSFSTTHFRIFFPSKCVYTSISSVFSLTN